MKNETAISASLVATTTPDPELEPPAECSLLIGLSTGPLCVKKLAPL